MTWRRRWVLLGLLGFAVTTPAAAQWTRGEPGGLWVKTAAFWQKTDERFDESSRRQEWFGSGESDARALFTDVIVGVHKRVDIWLQIPFFDLRFDNAADSLRTVGFGDIRAWVRWNVVSLGNGSTPISLRVGAKAPIGSSPLDAQIIPVGDGQWDFETFAEIGHSFWPIPAYAEVWFGYRFRAEDTEKKKDPGGEWVFLTEAGVNPTPRTLVKVTLDGFVGRNWVVENVETATKRRIVTLQLGGGFEIKKPVWTELGVRLPLSGRNFPAGPQYVIGLSAEIR